MRFMIDILHPAHVHFFRPFVSLMRERGHELLLLSRDKDVTLDLLRRYRLEHEVLSRQAATPAGLAVELATRTARFLRRARTFRPDYLLGLMGPVIALAGKALPAQAVVFYDNESAAKVNRFAYALCDAYWTPDAFVGSFGKKHHRYRGYHELAYLHPNRFTPDERIIEKYGLSRTEPYFLVRFVSWQSIHDIGESGFTLAAKRRLVEVLQGHGRVLISSESPLPDDLRDHGLRIDVEDIHHVLAYARLVVGESSTMASEACLLGTHAVYVSKTGRGVNDEQESRYGISHYFTSHQEEQAIERVRQLVSKADLKEDALERRARMLADNIDVTDFLVRYFESGGRDVSGARLGARVG